MYFHCTPLQTSRDFFREKIATFIFSENEIFMKFRKSATFVNSPNQKSRDFFREIRGDKKSRKKSRLFFAKLEVTRSREKIRDFF